MCSSDLGLVAAGAYQFSSLKMRCLTGCTRPMTFLLAHWREGISGAASLGMRHGLHCVGCCWVLMSVALIGGLHSLPVMAAVTIVMVVEKLPSVGETIRVPVGLLLVAAGGVTLVGALT